jgi:hypothetical protein
MPEFYVPFPRLKPDYGIPYTRVHLHRMMQRGQFPLAVQLSPNRIAWRPSDLDRWSASRPTAQSLIKTSADAAE